MSDTEIIKLLGQSSVSLAALVILGRIVWKVGLRMILAIDKLVDKIDSHSKADTAAWADVSLKVTQHFQEVSLKVTQHFQEVSQSLLSFRRELSQELAVLRQDLAVLGTRIDTILDVEPEPPKRRSRTEDGHTQRHDRIPVTDDRPPASRPHRRRDNE